MFTDTHCHILKEYYDNIGDVLSNAEKNGVNRFINSAYDMSSILEVIELANKYKNVYGVIGIHPENCDDILDESIFGKIGNKIIGIGEIGLDYHYEGYNKEKQIELFESQLKIAEEKNVPVVIHSREATEDTIRILKKYKVRGVIHSFSGSYETALIYIKMGFLLGVNGVVTFKNCNLSDVLVRLSPENIILETDCPYLTPVPYRGNKNEPAHIKDIAEFISNLYNIDIENLQTITNDNIRRVFDI